MKFNIAKEIKACTQSPVVGNVYNVRGGSGAKHGYMFLLVSIRDNVATYLTVNKEGEVVSGGNYGLHYFEDKCPIAFCSGLEELNFNIDTL